MSRNQSGTQTVVCVPELLLAGMVRGLRVLHSWISAAGRGLGELGNHVGLLRRRRAQFVDPSCWDGQAGDNQDHGRG